MTQRGYDHGEFGPPFWILSTATPARWKAVSFHKRPDRASTLKPTADDGETLYQLGNGLVWYPMVEAEVTTFGGLC